MADRKISEFAMLSAADASNDDTFPVVRAGGGSTAAANRRMSIRSLAVRMGSTEASVENAIRAEEAAALALAVPLRTFSTLSAAQSAIAAGDLSSAPEGAMIWIAGAPVMRQSGATALPGLPGWVPAGDWRPEHFGAVSSDVPDAGRAAANTTAFQTAIDTLSAMGGGTLHLTPGAHYEVSASTLGEVYFNDEVAVAAASGCVILRGNVSLSCPSRARIYSTNPTLTVIYPISPIDQIIEGVEVDGGWESGVGGAGHGIFTLSDGVSWVTRGIRYRRLHVHSVASYCIGLQNGDPDDVILDDILAEHCGADALDLKSRAGAASSAQSRGNTVSNIVARDYGSRVTGSAGIDMRGTWHASQVTAENFGWRNPALEYFGIRFRTLPTPESGEIAANYSTLDNYLVDGGAGTAAGANTSGVYSGSPNCTIGAGVVMGCRNNYVLSGNINGSPNYNKLMGTTAIGATENNYLIGASVTGTRIDGAVSVGAGIAGYRNQGDGTVMNGASIGDAASKSNSVGAQASETGTIRVIGGHGISMEDSRIMVRSPDANRALRIDGKGTAVLDLRDGTGPIANFVAQTEDQQAAMELSVRISGVRSVKRVRVGAADSGGTGYRALIVPN